MVIDIFEPLYPFIGGYFELDSKARLNNELLAGNLSDDSLRLSEFLATIHSLNLTHSEYNDIDDLNLYHVHDINLAIAIIKQANVATCVSMLSGFYSICTDVEYANPVLAHRAIESEIILNILLRIKDVSLAKESKVFIEHILELEEIDEFELEPEEIVDLLSEFDDDDTLFNELVDVNDTDTSESSYLPIWERDGYDSKEDWLNDKMREQEAIRVIDVDLGVHPDSGDYFCL